MASIGERAPVSLSTDRYQPVSVESRVSSVPVDSESRAARYCLVGSSGGHLMQLLATRDLWADADRSWVTFKKPDAVSLLSGERTYWCHYPTNRHFGNLLKNLALAFRVLRAERPDVIASTGAGAAIPFFLLGRIFGCTLVYIEVYDRIDTPTITGKICYRLAHVFAVQWAEQLQHYPKAYLIGPIV